MTPRDAARDTSRRPRRPKSADRFRYGWRDVHRTGPDGKKHWVQVPLTREDVLHPQYGDVIVESNEHSRDIEYLAEVCEARLADDPTALILRDVKVIWDTPGVRHHSPDVAVILGVSRPRRPRWRSFSVRREGVRPALIIEVTSHNTRGTDLRDKRRQYFQVGVPLYAILDDLPGPEDAPRRLRLLAYRRGRRGFERLPESEQGRVWLEPVRMWLGHADGRAAWFDERGERIGSYTEVAQERDAEKTRRAAAERGKAAAERRVRELEEEVRRLREGR
jgi:Uma2 family endonuclease